PRSLWPSPHATTATEAAATDPPATSNASDGRRALCPGGVEIAHEPDLGAVPEQLLGDPPDDLDQGERGIEARRVRAPADGVEVLVGHRGQAVPPERESVEHEPDTGVGGPWPVEFIARGPMGPHQPVGP